MDLKRYKKLTKESQKNNPTELEPGIIHDIRNTPEESTVKVAYEQLAFVEEIRKEKLKSYLFRKKIGTPIAAVLTPPCLWLDWLLMTMERASDDDGGFGITVVVMGIIYAWVTKPKKDYAKAYKTQLMPNIIKALGNFKYNVKGKINQVLMKPSKILPSFDRYNSEDHFEGTYKGSNIQFSEIELKKRRRSRKRTRYVTVFKGLALLFENKNRKFYGHTIIDYNKSKISEWFKEKTLDLKRANLVDPEFENIFDVYTNDQVEARYLVDPAIMEKLKALYEHYNGKGISAAYYNDKFLILIASRDNHFEPPDIYTPATNPKGLEDLKKEIEDVLDIGDHLELYDPKQVQAEKSTKQVRAE